MRTRLWQNEKGFSFIEVLVAMVLVGIIGTAFLTVYFSGIKASVHSEKRLEAIMLAQDVLEELRYARDAGEIQSKAQAEQYLLAQGYTATGGGWQKTETGSSGHQYVVQIGDILELEPHLLETQLVQLDVAVQAVQFNVPEVKLVTQLFLY